MLGVTYLNDAAAAERFVRVEHITYPVLRDISANFARAYGMDAAFLVSAGIALVGAVLSLLYLPKTNASTNNQAPDNVAFAGRDSYH